VGTLAAAGYKQVLEALRAAARAAGKQTYTMLVGKPNPAKLANFPEVEVWALVGDGPAGCRPCTQCCCGGHGPWMPPPPLPLLPGNGRQLRCC
jgi:hypothetical protein